MKQNSFNLMIAQLNMGFKQRRSFVFCPISVKNVMFLRLLMEEGFILGFFKSYTSTSKICVFIKYWDNKPLIKQIKLLKKSLPNIYQSDKQLKGDLKSQGLFVVSSSIGGFFLNSKLQNFDNNVKIGGKLIAKLEI
jgi:ribosomal protein S8